MSGSKFEEYYALAKPGLVYGNLITVIAGFLMGSVVVARAIVAGASVSFDINFVSLFATVVGIAFVMGSGCVFNNVIDRDIDASMSRTKDRATVTGHISKRAALIYGSLIGAAGFTTLALSTNFLAVAAAFFGWIVYVLFYSIWAKRRTFHAPLIGSVAGAVPPVVGYVAATGRLDLGSLLLFLILVLWQMPHFYSIAIYRRDDYTAAGVPVLPVYKGIPATKRTMLLYIIAFAVVAPSLAVFGYAGFAYFVIAIVLAVAWLGLCISGFRDGGGSNNDEQAAEQLAEDKRWARKMFFLSLIVMTVLFLTISIGALISLV